MLVRKVDYVSSKPIGDILHKDLGLVSLYINTGSIKEVIGRVVSTGECYSMNLDELVEAIAVLKEDDLRNY